MSETKEIPLKEKYAKLCFLIGDRHILIRQVSAEIAKIQTELDQVQAEIAKEQAPKEG